VPADHFTALLSTPAWAPLAAWVDGWLTCAGWWALVGTNGSLAGQLITGLVELWHPGYEVQRWLIFIVYAIWVVLALLLNTFAVKTLPLLNTTALFWSLTGVVVTIIVVLSVGRDHYQTVDFVFETTISQTGWPTGISWILGLLQSAFALTAFDSVMHLVSSTHGILTIKRPHALTKWNQAEEVPNPEWNCPVAMVAAIGIGSISGFLYLMCLLFSISDYNLLGTSPNGSLLEAYYQATSNRAGAVSLLPT